MKKQWQKNERKDAISFNAKQTPRSGGFWNMKGDSKSDNFLIDSKLTEKNRYSITKKIWEKIDREALLSCKVPLLSVEFGDSNIEIVILSKGDFLRMLKISKFDN